MKNLSITLRPWQLKDARFIISLRNRPELMKWFRQSEPITLPNQLKFMKSLDGQNYNGKIIYLNGKKIGVGAVKTTGELALVLPTKYRLQRRDIIRALVADHPVVWGDVFEGYDISWDLTMCGFKPISTLYKYERSDNKSKR
jgi:hypothetical protein